MTDTVEGLFSMAREDIAAARAGLAQGFVRLAVSRAYYALFYTAEALLAAEGRLYSGHSAVISAYGQHFAKTRRLSPEFHRYLREAFALRNDADYTVMASLTQDAAETVISWAQEFLEAAERFLAEQDEAGGQANGD